MLRKDWIEKRKKISGRGSKEKAIVAKLLPFLEPYENIGLYIPVRGEADVFYALKEKFPDKNLYVPKVVSNTDMVFLPANSLKAGAFGIPEPEENPDLAPEYLDVIVVPMVAFYQTHRMGYGGGYYDRYLKDKSVLKIGVAFDEQDAAEYGECFDIQPWDIEMDLILTPTRRIEKKTTRTDSMNS